MGAAESVPETSVHEFTVKVIHLLAESRHPASFFFFSNLFGGNFGSRIATARRCAWTRTRGRSSSSSTSPPNGWYLSRLRGSFLGFFASFMLACRVLNIVLCHPISGFTETNYTQLTELYQKYREKGQLPLLVYFVYRLDYMRKRPEEDCVPMFVEIIGCHFSGLLSGGGIG